MKSSHAALAAVCLSLAGLWYAAGGTTVPPQSAAAAERPRVSSPIGHDNLTVYFVHGPDAVGDSHKVATLQEALDGGWAVVHDVEGVNTLVVENLSPDYELFIQEGDMVKGGRQDRMIAVDLLVPPKSGKLPVPAHCVEAGRWTGRGTEAATHFAKSDQFAVGNDLRLANAAGQQSAVWDNVKKNQDKLSAQVGEKVNSAQSESSLQLALENRAVRARVSDFEQALLATGETRKNVVGVVFAVNGRVTGAEVYGSNGLFLKVWPKLLRSAAADAVSQKSEKATPAPPSIGEVERFLALAGNQGATPSAGGDIDGTTNDLLLASPDPDIRQNEFRGRSGSTRSVLLTGNGGANPAGNLNPTAQVQGVASGRAGGRQPSADQVRELNRVLAANPQTSVTGRLVQAESPGPNVNDQVAVQLDNVQQALRVGNATPAPVVVNTPGNRLNVNRVEDGGGLVSESRDPGRQNAVIHRSYIKK